MTSEIHHWFILRSACDRCYAGLTKLETLSTPHLFVESDDFGTVFMGVQANTKAWLEIVSERQLIVTNRFRSPIRARFMRLYPRTWHGHISMRVEFYGCSRGNGSIHDVIEWDRVELWVIKWEHMVGVQVLVKSVHVLGWIWVFHVLWNSAIGDED